MSLPHFQFEVWVSAGAVLLSEAKVHFGAGLGVVVSDILLLMFLKWWVIVPGDGGTPPSFENLSAEVRHIQGGVFVWSIPQPQVEPG